MAKKIIYNIDVAGFDHIISQMQSLQGLGGDVGKEATKILGYLSKISGTLDKFGDQVPVAEFREMTELYGKMYDAANKMSKMDVIKPMSDKDLAILQKAEETIKKLKQETEELKEKARAVVDTEGIRKSILKQKTISVSSKDPSIDGKRISLNKLGANRENLSIDDLTKRSVELQKNLEGLDAASPDYKETATELAAVNAVLAKYNSTVELAAKNTTAFKNSIDENNKKIKEQEKVQQDILNSHRAISVSEKQAAEEAKAYADEQIGTTNKLVQQAEDQGNATIGVNRVLEEHGKKVGINTQRILKYGAAYQLTKRIVRETIRTIKEMDKALTGMMVVTGMSREEAESYLGAIRDISSATSTAITEVANLTTEYLRQGRTMRDALTLTEQTAKAAKISGLSTADTIQYMTAAINGFNLAATQAERVSDIFSNLAATSATNYENLAISLSKVSAQANLAGMSIEYTSALLAKGMETTQEAPESIGTALKTVIARMRELDDYGATLEDGATVNSVEKALKSAGITLRTVTGEFRDLEDVFNELGPKWDKLNAMQQQAIAQAVAGTRQQSRFVAIMQDWERTQELITNAQDSAGASAAQYMQYEKGMEAALTRMQTAYQKLIQDISNSKFIIGSINTITKVLDTGPARVVALGAIVVGVINAVKKGIDNIRTVVNYIADIHDKILNKEAQEEQFNKKKIVDIAKQVQLREQELAIEKKRQELERVTHEKFSKMGTMGSLTKDKNNLQAEIDAGGLTDEEVAAKQAEILSIDQQIAQVDQERAVLAEQQKQLESEYQSMLDDHLEKTIEINQQYEGYKELSELATTEEQQVLQARIQDNETLIQTIQLEKEKLELEKQSAQLALEEAQHNLETAKSKEEQLEYQQQIDMYNGRINSIDAKITTLTGKQNKLLGQNSQLMSKFVNSLGKSNSGLNTLVNKLLRKYGLNMRDITNKWQAGVKFINDIRQGNNKNNISLKDTLQTEKDSLALLGKKGDEITKQLSAENLGAEEKVRLESQLSQIKDAMTQKQDTINKLSAVQNTMGEKDLVSKNSLLALGVEETSIEKVQTAEQEKQAAAQAATVVGAEAESAADAKDVPIKSAKAGWSMADSAAQMGPAGWIIAAAILAAVLGISIGVAASLAGNSESSKKEKLGGLQNNMYTLKKDNADRKRTLDEYNELKNKSVLTEEDRDRLEELEQTMRDYNENWANLETDQLLKEVNKSIITNSDNIAAMIDTSYDLAITMKDLKDNTLAQNAITTKLNKTTDRLIESNYELIKNYSDETVRNIKETTHSIITDYVAQLDTNDYLISQWDYLHKKDSQNTWTNIINSNQETSVPSAWIPTTRPSWAEAQQRTQQVLDSEAMDAALKSFSERATEFVTKYEEFLSDNTDQTISFGEKLSKYHELVEDFDESERAIIAQSYDTVGFVHELASVNGDYNDQIADNLTALTDLEVLTEESISKLAELMNGIEKSQEQVDAAAALVDEHIGNLDHIVNKYGFDEESTVTTLREQVLSKAKHNSDGTVMYKQDGSIAFWDLNAWQNDAYNTLLKLEEMGFGDVSYRDITALSKAYKEMNLQDFSTSLTDFTESLRNTADNYKEDDKLDLAGKVQAIFETANNEATGLFKQVNEWRDRAEQLEAQNAETQDADVQRLINNLNQQADKREAEINSTIQEIAGGMNSVALNDTLTAYKTVLDNVHEIQEMMNGEKINLNTDQIDALMNYGATLRDAGIITNVQKLVDAVNDGTAEGNYLLEEYANKYKEKILDQLNNAVEVNKYLYEHSEGEEKKLYEEQLARTTAIQLQAEQYLNSQEGITDEQIKQLNLESELARLQGQSVIDIKNLQQQQELLTSLTKLAYNDVDKVYEDLATRLSYQGKKITTARLKELITYSNGQLSIAEGMGEELEKVLGSAGVATVKEYKETLADKVAAAWDYEKQFEENQNTMLELEVAAQDEAYDAYIKKLQKEQEALKASLDARKKMYEKYFDALNQEDEDEDYETRRAQLEEAIAKLSTATDAGSLQKLRDYQQELNDLDEDYNDTIRDRMREATLANLDNEGTIIENQMQEAETNKRTIIEALTSWGKDDLLALLRIANDYDNQTDETRQQIEKSVELTVANLLADTPRNANGGLVDYTGLAWVDGTSRNPEAFLSADQTQLFASLGSTLQGIYNRGNGYSTDNVENNNIVIEGINVNVSGTLNSEIGLENTGNNIADALLEGLRRNGIAINRR